MSDEEAMRLIRALVAKWQRAPLALGDQLSRETLEGIIGTTVADVLLVTDGTLTIADYERPVPIPGPSELEPDSDWLDDEASGREPTIALIAVGVFAMAVVALALVLGWPR